MQSQYIYQKVVLFNKIVTILVRLTFSCVTAILTAQYFIPLAYKQRGYYAIGGEWLLIIGAWLLVWWVSKHLLKEAYKRKNSLDHGNGTRERI